MKYENKEFGIVIENSQFFKIKEIKGDYARNTRNRVELRVDNKKVFVVFPNSNIEATKLGEIKTMGHSDVEVYNGGVVFAYDNSTIETKGRGKIYAHNNAFVHGLAGTSTTILKDNSKGVFEGKTKVKAYDKSRAQVREYAEIYGYDEVELFAYDNSIVNAYNNTTVHTNDNTTIKAMDNAKVNADGNANVYACNNSEVKAKGNVKVEAINKAKVEARGSARVQASCDVEVALYDESTVELFEWFKSSKKEDLIIKAFDKSTVYAYSQFKKIEAYDFSVIYIGVKYKNKVDRFNHYGVVLTAETKVKKTMIVYKKLENNLIAELKLKKGQVFQSERFYKCRTNKAKVISITNIDGTEKYKEGYSVYDEKFVYKVGKTVKADYDKRILECSTGIHFFLTREKAVEY